MKKLALIIIIPFLFSCSGSINHVSKPQLGTIVNLTFSCNAADASDIAQNVFSEIERIEKIMSPAHKESDIFRLNRDGAAGPVSVGPETFEMIRKSVALSKESDGCFDITFASVAHLWNYKNKNFIPPDRAAVKALLPLVNYRNIVMDPGQRTVSFARPGVKIGLGAIAKGYAVEKGIEILKKRGVTSAIVEAGGDLQVMGKKQWKNWITGLRHPRKNAILLTIDLEDMDAVATSGDYERFVMYRNVRYHHIIDPRNGYPTNTFSSVTVISKNATLSDAYATAIFVMGLDAAREFLKRHGEIDVILVDTNMNAYISARLKKRITFLEMKKAEWL